MKETILKPSELKKKLKKRLADLREKVEENLPRNWALLFIHDNREYSGQGVFLSNVYHGRSLHEETITKLETWVDEQIAAQQEEEK